MKYATITTNPIKCFGTVPSSLNSYKAYFNACLGTGRWRGIRYKGILFAKFGAVGQWKLNAIKHFTFHNNVHGQVNKTVGIVTDCLATVRRLGLAMISK